MCSRWVAFLFLQGGQKTPHFIYCARKPLHTNIWCVAGQTTLLPEQRGNLEAFLLVLSTVKSALVITKYRHARSTANCCNL